MMKSKKYKSLILFCLVLLIFSGLTCVCAQDMNDTDTRESNDDIILKDIDDEAITENNEENLVDDGTFSELQEIVDNVSQGSTVILDKDYTSSGNQITISKSLTIDGKNHILDGNKSSRIFLIAASNVTIKNINFINGHNSENGGALYLQYPNFTIENCNFINNTADSNGGSVYVVGYNKNGILSNCNFMNNNVFYYGGAIYYDYDNSNMTLINCNFTKNKAHDGGAIYWLGKDSTITNCNFAKNTASENERYDYHDPDIYIGHYDGGAIYLGGENNAITNCNFSGNTGKNGGAIRSYYNSNSLSNCYFAENTALYGGAVNIEGSAGDMTNCNFTGNSADNGGAVYYVRTSANMIKCKFTGNSATESGSAVYCLTYKGNITNCNFTRNIKGYGAAYGNLNYIIDSYFAENSPSGINMGPSCVVINCTFTSNHGVGIRCWGSGNNITNCTFTNNSNDDYGAGVYFGLEAKGVVSNCTFTNNTAKDGAAVAYWYNSACTVNNCKFSQNTPHDYKIIRFATRIEKGTTYVNYGENTPFGFFVIDEWGNDVKKGSVTVKLNGKTQVIKIRSFDRLNTKSLIPKTYTATIIFKGDNKYAPSKATFKVIVFKVNPKIIAKAKTFKKSIKTKKYTITLKTNLNKAMKNKKVTLKINKKIYTAKTNAKGQATFKITKLNKKGTFKAVITYNGDKCYEKMIEVAKIKVK